MITIDHLRANERRFLGKAQLSLRIALDDQHVVGVMGNGSNPLGSYLDASLFYNMSPI